uniref:Amidohydrolase n=1 Tax=mine drainage metagenome TaxID=410659 RepID=E6PF90_9ZZZZ
MTFRVGVLYDGTLAKARRNVDVTIADGRVRSIEEGAAGSEHLRRVPCMTPGLTNAHVHWKRAVKRHRRMRGRAARPTSASSLPLRMRENRSMPGSRASAISVARAGAR